MVERSQLSAAQLEDLEAHEARVTWAPFLEFVGPDPADPKDHEPKPVDVGNSIVDRERRGHLVLEHSYDWSGAVKFQVSDGEQTIDFMLDNTQIATLRIALERWAAGTLQDWLEQRRTP